jgi:restriction system protein
METRAGQIEVHVSARGATYSVDLWHDGLRKHRKIRGESLEILKIKSSLQIQDWDDKWNLADARDSERRKKAAGKRLQEELKAEAEERTQEAKATLNSLSNLLSSSLGVDDRIDWETLKNLAPFQEPRPSRPKRPLKPLPPQLPTEPRADAYLPAIGFLDRIIPERRRRKMTEAQERLTKDWHDWKQTCQQIQERHESAICDYENQCNEQDQSFEMKSVGWARREKEFLQQQESANQAVDEKKAAYFTKDPEAILEYCDLVLSFSNYPDLFPKEFELEYRPETKTLIVGYVLPAPEAIPTLKSVKYIASRGELEPQHMTEGQAARQYDNVIYQVILRTIHELFEADAAEALETIVINGIVTALNRSTGLDVTSCIISLRAGKSEFMKINLANVDPKACFKSLKGVCGSNLHGLAAVPPIMVLNREDSRFVEAYEVAGKLDGSDNLAAMDWQDFEHLIREVFAQEFSSTGGEVKVTQASRDGGVDAIAFDPDPIRGGKIVIQAKRFTNTVGVGAVRDLYGTVVNEGATKGVLVTTSDYGPDSYAFANGKPLVLLNGANLLHMLEKHGHKARIDLGEARSLAFM